MAQETKIELPKPVQDALLKGRIVFYGEFRRGIASEFTGKSGRVYHKSTCTVESESATYTVVEFLPDGTDTSAWKPPFNRGQTVYGVVRTVDDTSGVQVVSAKLYAA